MEYKDETVIVEYENTIQYIADSTGYSKEIIANVLEAETQYLINIGVAATGNIEYKK